MKKTTLLLMIMLLFGVVTMSAKNKANEGLSYELKCAGNGQQGYFLVEVTAYVDKKGDINMDLLKKCAIHGVLFKGFSGEQGCKSQKPMLSPTTEQQHADFFNAFFTNDYLSYASAVDPSMKTVKVGKRYAVTATLQVSKDELRKAMEQAGVLRKLGF